MINKIKMKKNLISMNFFYFYYEKKKKYQKINKRNFRG